MRPKLDLSLYLVTDRALSMGKALEDVVRQAVKGGVTLVQLREKDCSSAEFYRLAVSMKNLLSPYNIPLIINDRLDIALACNAEGLHIGQSDLPYAVARRLMGDDKIIGISVETIQDVLAANELDVDYIGISPVFDTDTKKDTSAAFGLEGVNEIAAISKHPSVGIGGVNAANAANIIKAGADGISVVSAIMSAQDPKQAAETLAAIVRQSKRKEHQQ